MDLVVASTGDAVMMVESEIKELSEEEVLNGVMFAHRANQQVIDAIIELADHSAKEPFEIAGIIAEYAKDKGFELIFTGMQSQDRGSGQVGILVAEMLGLPELGRIAVGAPADLCLWDIRQPAELAYAVQAGRLRQRIFCGEITHAR